MKLFAIIILLTSVVRADTCTLTTNDIKQNLALNWRAFDQDLLGGHRVWGHRGCNLEEGFLIDVYTLTHLKHLEDYQTRVLYFHAGQTYAYAELNDLAAERMLNSFDPNESEQPELNWNDYVRATIGFLKNDLQSLKENREKMAAGKQTEGNKINLSVVDRLITCFGKPYSSAYGNPNLCK